MTVDTEAQIITGTIRNLQGRGEWRQKLLHRRYNKHINVSI